MEMVPLHIKAYKNENCSLEHSACMQDTTLTQIANEDNHCRSNHIIAEHWVPLSVKQEKPVHMQAFTACQTGHYTNC